MLTLYLSLFKVCHQRVNAIPIQMTKYPQLVMTNTSVKQHCVFAPKYLVRIREASSAVVSQETILPVCVSFVLPFSFTEHDFRCSNSDM